MKYTIKGLIKKLRSFDENLQVTIFNHEYMYNSPDIRVEVIEKKEEIQYPFEIMSDIDERFLSLS